MPRIYVEFSKLKSNGEKCKTVAGKVDGIRSDFQRTISQLDWDVKYESDINNIANQLVQKLDRYTQALKSYQSFINDAYDKYVKLDNETNGSSNTSWLQSVGNWFDGIGESIGDATRAVGDTVASWWDSTTGWFGDVGNGINAAWGTTCEFLKENWQELGMTAVGVAESAAGVAVILAAIAAAPAGGVSLAAIAPGVAMIISGANTATKNITSMTGANDGKGYDLSDWIGMIDGDGQVADSIGTAIEMGISVYSGYGIAKSAHLLKGAATVSNMSKIELTAANLARTSQITSIVGDIAFSGVGEIIDGNYVSGSASILFSLFGDELFGDTVLRGRPTGAINLTAQDSSNILNKLKEALWSEGSERLDSGLRSIFAY